MKKNSLLGIIEIERRSGQDPTLADQAVEDLFFLLFTDSLKMRKMASLPTPLSPARFVRLHDVWPLFELHDSPDYL